MENVEQKENKERIIENKNYRELFKEYYHIEFSSNYDIHHIDLNHNNNDIDNLMILPKKLHQQYHNLLNSINYEEDIFLKKFSARINGNSVNSNNYNISMIEEFIPVFQKCNMWFDYKMYLDGILPNIHNFKLED